MQRGVPKLQTITAFPFDYLTNLKISGRPHPENIHKAYDGLHFEAQARVRLRYAVGYIPGNAFCEEHFLLIPDSTS